MSSIRQRLAHLEARQKPGNNSSEDLADLFRRVDAVRAGGEPDPELSELMASVDRQRRGGIPQPHHADGVGNGGIED